MTTLGSDLNHVIVLKLIHGQSLGGLAVATVDISPSPRVLRMLGQIDFAPWQCLSELIDNSIDAFIDQANKGKASAAPKIEINLPTDGELKAGTGQISLRDNASGMPVDSLSNAVKAGYSGNDPIEKMGLFGMGFNISTARLGRKTEVWTTRAEDSEWTGLIIDFDDLERQGTFNAPIKTRNKSEAELNEGVHGTEIIITQLERDRITPLILGGGNRKTRRKLGKVYGRIMNRLGINIYYGKHSITPWKHCLWDKKRTVDTKEFGKVPAVIEIDEKLDPKKFCTTCWVWLQAQDTSCHCCGDSKDVITRDRKLKGWVGVQRYFDKKHYGIDLIRNGRVIEELDKSFFSFTDDSGDSLFEYPVDATYWGGRLVGELEIDFVRVSHQKDSFDKLDPEWKKVVELVRGTSPMQPKKAEEMKLGRNTSPLSRLFTAYRKNTAGLKALVPYDPNKKSGSNTGLVMEYVDAFYNNDAEHQSDEKMYELVKLAASKKGGKSSGGRAAAGILPLPGQPSNAGTGSPKPDTPPAINPPAKQPKKDVTLSRTYEIGKIDGYEKDTFKDIQIKVEASEHNEDIEGKTIKVKPDGFKLIFDYNSSSKFFENNLDTPADYLAVDLAQHFLTLSSHSVRDVPISRIVRYLKEKYFSELSDDLSEAANAAAAVLNELKAHYSTELTKTAPITDDKLNLIPKEHLNRAKKTIEKALGKTESEVQQQIENGDFAEYLEDESAIELFRIWPELATDGKYFDRPYQSSSDEHKPNVLSEIIKSLQDIAWIVTDGVSAINKDTTWRLRFDRALASLRLIQHWSA